MVRPEKALSVPGVVAFIGLVRKNGQGAWATGATPPAPDFGGTGRQGN